MSLTDFIKEILSRKKMQKKVEGVKDVYDEEEDEKESIQRATDRVIKVIEAHPDMPVIEFLKMIQEEEKLPGDIVVEATKKIKDEQAAEAVKELDFASKEITSIIEEADISLNTAQKMVEQIPDEKIKKEQQRKLEKRKEQEILEQLQKIYDNCEEMNDNQLIQEIEDIEIAQKSSKTEEKIKHIIAKKIALDYMQFGGPKISTMARVISLEEMLEMNFPFLVEKEYQSISKEYDEKRKRYHEYDTKGKELLKKKILEHIARMVAENFEEIGDIRVPQSEQMRNVTKEELEIFIEAVKNSCKKEELSEVEVERIKKQVRGDTSTEIDDVIRMLDKMKPADRERFVARFKEEMQENEEKTEQERELDGAIDTLQQQIKKLPIEDGIQAATMMSQMLQERQEAREMIKKLRKPEEQETQIKETKRADITQSDDDDQISL